MNNKNIQTIALEELWKQNTEGHLPFLMEIYNPDIKWEDNSLEQENMYLRVINDSNPVRYQGKKYLPCAFEFSAGEEDGKTIKSASITISALDSRITQMLRSIEVQCELDIKAMFAIEDLITEDGETKKVYKFFPVTQFKGKMPSASYNRTTAQLNLIYKDVLSLNVPRDIATKNKLPSVNENA